MEKAAGFDQKLVQGGVVSGERQSEEAHLSAQEILQNQSAKGGAGQVQATQNYEWLHRQSRFFNQILRQKGNQWLESALVKQKT